MARKRRKVSNKQSSGKSKVGITLTSTGVDLLNEMAQKAGLSKSQLVEQFARGYVALASTTAQKTITLESIELDSNQNADNKTIIEVVSSSEKVDQKLDQVNQGISLEEYETLKGNIQGQEAHIVELEQKLHQGKQEAEAQHNYTIELEQKLSQGKQQLEEKNTYIAELKQQLSQGKQEAEVKDNLISELEQKLNQRKQEVEVRNNHITELKQKLAEQESQNQEIQIVELEKRLFQQRTQATRQAKNYRELKKQINTKDRQITLLKSQMADLQRLAAIGEAQLNKWRDRHFNS